MDYKYFKESELKCSVTGECVMDSNFMKKVEELREEFGHPMFINSGYRHPTRHPIEAKKVTSSGWHPKGRALDVALSGHLAYKFIKLAMARGFSVGVCQHNEWKNRFVHIDDRPGDPVIWSYP